MWTSLKSLVPSAASRLNMTRQAEENEIFPMWFKIANSLFNKGSQNKFKPLYFKNKTLFVRCPNSVWANELQTKQKELVGKMNSQLKQEKVERIKFVF
jgi:predicted nucleic acid-binding Zn ribbon protein